MKVIILALLVSIVFSINLREDYFRKIKRPPLINNRPPFDMRPPFEMRPPFNTENIRFIQQILMRPPMRPPTEVNPSSNEIKEQKKSNLFNLKDRFSKMPPIEAKKIENP